MKLLDKYITKLKRKIADWLGIPKIEYQLYAVTKDVNTLNSLVKCGVDVHLHQSCSSWAVVCLAGKTEYVNFVRLDDKSVIEVRDFLRNFQERNTRLDMPSASIPRDAFWR